MNITIINGTEQKGCTLAMKDMFLSSIGVGHNVTEYFLPRDCPVFCTGCKTCIYRNNINVCPHSQYTVTIWGSILSADLLVFTSPTYVFHVTAQMKALLDHFAIKWMAHSPEKSMFRKQAVIIVNAIGRGMDKTARDIRDSLDYWGVARTYVIKQALFQAKWDDVSDKRKAAVRVKCEKAAAKIKSIKCVKPRLKVKAIFHIMKIAHVMIDRSERRAGRDRTRDYLYWKENGWLDGKRPWSE